jgi:acetyl esterase/lipase
MSELLRRLARFIRITRFIFLQTFQRNIVSLKSSRFFSPETQPDAWKVIAGRAYLYPSRIFRPRIKDAQSTPLIIMIHGGAFIMNNPSADDPLARRLADKCSATVVSIDYRKAPRHPFPAGYEDVVESIIALLRNDGDSLPINRSKVILFGSSSGGNLALAAAQDPRIRGKLLGVVALYPIANFVPTVEEQMAKRPDPSVPDFLADMWNDGLDVYVGKTDTTTLQDPRLSPTYFEKRDHLPENIFLLGCEHDILCYEAKVMADKLMDATSSRKEQAIHDQHAEGVYWTLAKGQAHAFDRFARKVVEEETIRLREKSSMYEGIVKWLNGVFGGTI